MQGNLCLPVMLGICTAAPGGQHARQARYPCTAPVPSTHAFRATVQGTLGLAVSEGAELGQRRQSSGGDCVSGLGVAVQVTVACTVTVRDGNHCFARLGGVNLEGLVYVCASIQC